MHDYPHVECTAAEQSASSLVGLSVARGFTRAVRERIGGVRGCDHIAHLMTALAPATIQALGGMRHRRARDADARPEPESGWKDRLLNSCHIWAEGGPGEQKVDLGWFPAADEYPAPAVEVIRARRT